MKRFAIVKDNEVINVLVAESVENLGPLVQYAIDCTDGWDFDNGIKTNSFFVQPVVEIAATKETSTNTIK